MSLVKDDVVITEAAETGKWFNLPSFCVLHGRYDYRKRHCSVGYIMFKAYMFQRQLALTANSFDEILCSFSAPISKDRV